jgi:hypothetical protein
MACRLAILISNIERRPKGASAVGSLTYLRRRFAAPVHEELFDASAEFADDHDAIGFELDAPLAIVSLP